MADLSVKKPCRDRNATTNGSAPATRTYNASMMNMWRRIHVPSGCAPSEAMREYLPMQQSRLPDGSRSVCAPDSELSSSSSSLYLSPTLSTQIASSQPKSPRSFLFLSTSTFQPCDFYQQHHDRTLPIVQIHLQQPSWSPRLLAKYRSSTSQTRNKICQQSGLRAACENPLDEAESPKPCFNQS